MVNLPYTFKKDWIKTNTKPILKVSAIDSEGSVVDSIEGNVSLDGLDMPEYARRYGNITNEIFENALEEMLKIRLKQTGNFGK